MGPRWTVASPAIAASNDNVKCLRYFNLLPVTGLDVARNLVHFMLSLIHSEVLMFIL